MSKYISLFFCMLLASESHSQPGIEGSAKAYSYMTVYYVDNSSGYESAELNAEMKEELKNNLNRLINRPDNYFFIYACNGEEPKMSNNLGFVTDPSKSFLKKYLSRDSDESEYGFDKKSYRENIVDYPVRIKQNLEFNFYLSEYSVKRLMDNIEDLPAPLVMPHELPVYLHSSDLKVKVNIYINLEAKEKYGEENIKSYFLFCNSELNNEFIQTVFYFL